MLDRKTFFIREHVGLLKLTDSYDILDPETKAMLGLAKEETPPWVHLLRLAMDKRLLPTAIEVRSGTSEQALGPVLFRIERSFNLGFQTRVNIVNGQGQLVGWFRKKALSLGGAFLVFDATGTQVATFSGNWVGWDFTFTDVQGKQIGRVSKKWAGIGKELFTTADNYMISLEQANPAHALLLLAAGLSVDIIFNER